MAHATSQMCSCNVASLFLFRLVGEGFLFKPEESNKILYKILSQQLVVDERDEAARFLLRNGALVNVRYAGADT